LRERELSEGEGGSIGMEGEGRREGVERGREEVRGADSR